MKQLKIHIEFIIFIALLNAISFCSAPPTNKPYAMVGKPYPEKQKSDVKEKAKLQKDSLESFALLIEFNQVGSLRIYLYDKKRSLKSDIALKHHYLIVISKYVLKKAQSIRIHTRPSQFIIEPDGKILLKLTPVLLYDDKIKNKY